VDTEKISKKRERVNVVHIEGGYSGYRKVVIETGRPNGGMFVLCGALHLRQ